MTENKAVISENVDGNGNPDGDNCGYYASLYGLAMLFGDDYDESFDNFVDLGDAYDFAMECRHNTGCAIEFDCYKPGWAKDLPEIKNFNGT